MRKFTLLLVALYAITFTSKAQISKGTVLLGGNISASSSNANYTSNTTDTESEGFNIAPSIGFVTSTNSAWGFDLSYSNFRTKYADPNNNNRNESNGFGGGVFYRRYVTLGKGFYVFGQAGAHYHQNKQHAEFTPNGYSATTNTKAIYLSAYPGVSYTVNKKFHLEIGLNSLVNLGYSSSKTTNIGTSGSRKQNDFSFSTNLSNSNPFNVGFRFALGK